ncbi:pyridoxamine 5'-phosphate oxidase family protein [Flavobacteriaceae bacterium 14752]|uniref:pyridoxamine 5'-phosphate oxidase family protein n=1 Tax=Mesohalobacter salilacus TaxID=2491711 RepID=UPI000F63F966|nr:pyridoxamine 5'-phosphate oxidase [Flavobacteriaceae bacterium 14752]
MLDSIFKSTLQEIKFGYLKRKHPFKYCSLSSISEDRPIIRTVVLREMTNQHELVFFTDQRSPKIEQYKKNPHAEVLFYHPKKLWQIKVSGKVQLIKDEKRLHYYRQSVQGASTNDYKTKQTPSSVIKNPDQIEYGEDLHFAVLGLQPDSIESLQLKRPNHIRCRFKRANDWQGEFLVP